MKKYIAVLLLLISASISHAQCYHEKSDSLNGYVGSIDGQRFYYQCWVTQYANGVNSNTLLIKTDTASLKNYSFCLNEKDSTVMYYRYSDQEKKFIPDASLTIEKIPAMMQFVKLFDKGNYSLSGKSNAKIYMQGNNLIIQYTESSPQTGFTFHRQLYKYEGKKFVFLKDEIKTIPADKLTETSK